MKPSQKRRKKAARSKDWGPWLPCRPLHIKSIGEKYDATWRNNVYQVSLRKMESPFFKHDDGTPIMLTYVTIKRNDREAIHDWRDIQRIKNELLGVEVEAVELYPAESRLMDTSNQYHLWALEDGVPWPLGFFDPRCVTSPEHAEKVGAKQRPFDNPPGDIDEHAEEMERQHDEMKVG